MDVEKLIGELSEHRKLMWTVDMKPGVPRCHAVPLDLIVEAADALAKLQAERDAKAILCDVLSEKLERRTVALERAEAELNEAREVIRGLLTEWPEDSVPSGPLCVRASRALGGGE